MLWGEAGELGRSEIKDFSPIQSNCFCECRQKGSGSFDIFEVHIRCAEVGLSGTGVLGSWEWGGCAGLWGLFTSLAETLCAAAFGPCRLLKAGQIGLDDLQGGS